LGKGYNMQPGGRGSHAGDMIPNPNRAVVITILDTGAELHFPSARKAAKEMCTSPQTIGRLVNKEIKKRKCKGGKYLNKFFTARFAIVR